MKITTKILWAFALLAATVFTSCKDDDNDIPMCEAVWTLTLPEDVAGGTLTDMTASFTNINTSTEYTDATITDVAGGGLTVSATVPEGLYRVSVEGKLTYTLNGQATSTGVRAYRESVMITGQTATLPAAQLSFFSPSTGFVIEEIFFTGTTTPTGDQYSNDQYFKITNNSSEVLYADGLAILESQFMTVQKEDYTPDLMKDAFTVDFVFVIPGSGTEHPVEPGASIIVALTGIDHRTGNPNSFDLSTADFEFYDESPNPQFQDIDSPSVPNLDKWYSSTASYTNLHNRGFHSYALAKMGVDKETFLRDYTYTAEWLFVFEEYEFPMSGDYYYVPNSWIVDAVNLSIDALFEWIVTDPSLDAGWTHCGSIDKDPARYNKSVRRKVESTTADGRRILKDTNNSTADFEADATPSLLE